MPLPLDRFCDRADRIPLAALILFLIVLSIAGGASRSDALGQSVVRAAGILVLIGLVVSRVRLDFRRYRPVILIVGACAVMILVQLLPLPPALWTALPGRALLAAGTHDAGLPLPWRPIAIVPDGAVNALFSLVVPVAALCTIAGLGERGLKQLLPIVIGWVGLGALISVLQASGGWFENPLINDVQGEVAGFFANRNHDALFMAIGALCALAWGVKRRAPLVSRQGMIGVALAILFLLTSLATGSRTGLAVTVIALLFGMVLPSAKRKVPSVKMWAAPAILAVLVVCFFFYMSVSLDRADSVNRLLTVDTDSELRLRAAPVVLQMIATYFPVGSGGGSFDPIFRIAEPRHLLEILYFNHAHDDWLEVVLEYGVLGVAVLLASFSWVAYRASKSWRAWRDRHFSLARLASGMILLTALASVTDYPGRTPIVMALLVIAGCWLCTGPGGEGEDEHRFTREDELLIN